MNKKICVITGANSGIGKEAAIQIAAKGYHVIIACRNQERGAKALSEIQEKSASQNVELQIVDMSSKASIRAFSEALHGKFDRIDTLIHNAAIFDISQKKPAITEEGIESIWMTNHIGPVYLTDLLLDLLRNSEDGRILTVSSKGLLAKPFLKVNLEDPEYQQRKFSVEDAYYQSKAAQVMYTYWLAKELEESNISVNAIRVPAVQIDIDRLPDFSPFMKWVYLQKRKMSITPSKMAETYAWLACEPELKGASGKYYDENNSEVKPNRYMSNWENISAVMELTKSYLKVDNR